MNTKKMKKDLIAATAVFVTTLLSLVIGYLAISNTLQLWQTFLQYLAQGQNVSIGQLVVAVWQNIGLQLLVPGLAVYGCFVLAHYVFGQANLTQARLKAFWFGVSGLMLGSLMLIFPTPEYVLLTVLVFVIPSLVVMFLSIERPAKTVEVSEPSDRLHRSRSTKQHYRRYLAK